MDDAAAPIAFGVDCRGALYAAAGQAKGVPYEQRGPGLRPMSRFEVRTDYRVFALRGGDLSTTLVRDVAVPVSFVQPLTEAGGFLLAGARCYYSPGDIDRNALMVDGAGQVLSRLTLGDGIEDLRVAPGGTIWVSFFDEGVFGNYGWNDPGPPGPGAAGLLALSRTGDAIFRYDSEAAGTDSICDAYALNVVSDDEAWIYFYTEFSIVRIFRGTYQAWRCGVRGARGLAVRDRHALLVGAYGDPGVAQILALPASGRAKVTKKTRVVTEDGSPLDHAILRGIGDRLFFFQDMRVYILDCW